MMRPDAKVEKVYLYPKPVDFRKSIDGLAALVELCIKVAVFDPVLFVFLNKPRNRVKILYWERNGFCLWLKRLESERFKTSPDAGDEAICPHCSGVQLDARRFRPLAKPSSSGFGAAICGLIRYDPGHGFRARKTS
ncbi:MULTISPECIES: IS66 family insertion sequence element accessory protein TnpB [unclassified Pseudomonas]|uniref:IS66 family insertion sequence element accessory protein TnpB n=1 Tax=unclassified Pseudomonas TaxID=196821 RepID=UPI002AC8CA16|nr:MULTISPECIES: IS66 family insertion sequence element accessory protein TnpB [unclassified Pseudomonas]MEB0047229.1 IS66 family insertion sequence element accessory protein TnpB [Pseudomonas sp. Dout3]MEB0096869.1 IS66 family insertion sequence element accessory protein TnpB [Pseudomonas sp. DC1.2]WPX57381.1 IS66 family insertion sequence element accessory protein TnpB [Pseudomonas sp. DC1.2]